MKGWVPGWYCLIRSNTLHWVGDKWDRAACGAKGALGTRWLTLDRWKEIRTELNDSTGTWKCRACTEAAVGRLRIIYQLPEPPGVVDSWPETGTVTTRSKAALVRYMREVAAGRRKPAVLIIRRGGESVGLGRESGVGELSDRMGQTLSLLKELQEEIDESRSLIGERRPER